MTLRLILGCDPGQTGAIAALADGEPVSVIDMPTLPRKAGGHQIDAATLAASLRGLLTQHPDAYVLAVVEQVGAMPRQGVTSTFRFGQADGILRGVLGALGIGLVEVSPAVWKRSLGLPGEPKDMARTRAIQRWPQWADRLSRKRDCGRADALLIALWAEDLLLAGEYRCAAVRGHLHRPV